PSLPRPALSGCGSVLRAGALRERLTVPALLACVVAASRALQASAEKKRVPGPPGLPLTGGRRPAELPSASAPAPGVRSGRGGVGGVRPWDERGTTANVPQRDHPLLPRGGGGRAPCGGAGAAGVRAHEGGRASLPAAPARHHPRRRGRGRRLRPL